MDIRDRFADWFGDQTALEQQYETTVDDLFVETGDGVQYDGVQAMDLRLRNLYENLVCDVRSLGDYTDLVMHGEMGDRLEYLERQMSSAMDVTSNDTIRIDLDLIREVYQDEVIDVDYDDFVNDDMAIERAAEHTYMVTEALEEAVRSHVDTFDELQFEQKLTKNRL